MHMNHPEVFRFCCTAVKDVNLLLSGGDENEPPHSE